MNATAKVPTKDCDDIHDEHFERRATPRIRLLVLSYFAAAVGTLASVGFFAISAQITAHSLAEKETTVSRREFDGVVSRIERKIETLDSNINESLQNVSDKLDENHQAIIRSQARR